MLETSEAQAASDKSSLVLWTCAGLALLVHLLTNQRYGYFRDELYFIACARHLDFGYVDLPPLSMLLLRFEMMVFGDSLFAVRIFSALASAGMVALTGLLARELGGRIWGVSLGCIGALTSLYFLAIGNFYTPQVYEPLFWTGAIYFLVRIINGAPGRTWIWFGVMVGLGLQDKHSMAFFAAAIVLAILFTPERRHFGQKWIWLAGLVAFLIALPNVLWQIEHGWPTWVLLNNIAHSNKNVVLTPLQFIAQQFTLMNPGTAPLWLGGLIWLARGARRPALPRHRVHLSDRARRIHRHARQKLLPRPSLPDVVRGRRGRRGTHLCDAPALAQAGPRAGDDRVGGGSLADRAPDPAAGKSCSPTCASCTSKSRKPRPRSRPPCRSFTPINSAGRKWCARSRGFTRASHLEEQKRVAIFCQDYGEAGAIDFFGPKYGLPPALSGHQNYFYWGPGKYSGEIMIVLDDEANDEREQFRSVEDRGPVESSNWAMPGEQRQHIYVCRDFKGGLRELWPKVRKWL